MPDFPASPAPASVAMKKNFYNVRSESVNGRVQVRSLGASRREWTLKYPPMTKAEFANVYAFIDAKAGGLNSFTMYVPDPTSTDPFDFSTGSGCVEVTVRQSNDLQEYDVNTGSFYRFELDVIEVL